MTAVVIAIGIAVVVLLNSIATRLRELVGVVRRGTPGCTCPMHGLAPSSTCPAHKEYGPRGVEPTWYPPVPPGRPAAPPPDSTDAFYVPPGRGE